MNPQVLDSIKEALENITQLTPEKLQELVQETLAAFHTIQEQVSSTNEADREQGLRSAIELKAVMEENVKKLQEKLGMSPEEIENYLSNSANFSKNQYKAMDESKKDLEQFKSQFQEKVASPRKKKRNQHLLVG
jgi:predicted solute-binding protein